MNGYDLTNKMRRTRRRYPLTSTEQALYNELVAICNEDEWADTFCVSNQELCNALQITEKTLTVARLALIQAGLIFYRSGQSKRQFGKYSFETDFGSDRSTVKIPVDTPTNPTANKGGDTTANNTAYPTAQATDYTKPKEKTNKTKVLRANALSGDGAKVLKNEYVELSASFEGKNRKELWALIKNFISEREPDFIEPYVDLWNVFATNYKLAEVISISEGRRKKFATRIREEAFDYLKILAVIAKSGYLQGKVKDWKVDFDWVLENDTNYLKILEEKYD